MLIGQMLMRCPRFDQRQGPKRNGRRTAESTLTDTESVGRSIQAGVTRQEAEGDEERQEGLCVEREVAEVGRFVADPGAFDPYRRAMRAALAETEESGRAGKKTSALIAGLALTRGHRRMALGSPLPVTAPASRQRANSRAPSLIEDRLPLPGRLLLSDPARLASLHDAAGLAVVQIARRLGVSHSAVLAALGKLGIAAGGGQNGRVRRGQVPFGWDLQDCRLVRNGKAQMLSAIANTSQIGVA